MNLLVVDKSMTCVPSCMLSFSADETDLKWHEFLENASAEGVAACVPAAEVETGNSTHFYHSAPSRWFWLVERACDWKKEFSDGPMYADCARCGNIEVLVQCGPCTQHSDIFLQ